VRARFAAFCTELAPAIEADDASLPVFLDFLLALAENDLSAATVQSYASEIDHQRRRRVLPTFSHSVE
jgi:hypothetical protein